MASDSGSVAEEEMVDQRAKGLRRRLGSLLRVIRSRAGLSGPQLARLMGVNQSTVSRLENAERWPSLADVEAWLAACNAEEVERARVIALAEAISHAVPRSTPREPRRFCSPACRVAEHRRFR